MNLWAGIAFEKVMADDDEEEEEEDNFDHLDDYMTTHLIRSSPQATSIPI